MTHTQTLTILGISSELIGFLILILNQTKFMKEIKSKYGSINRYYIFMAGTFLGSSLDDLKKMPDSKIEDTMKKIDQVWSSK